MEQMINYIGSVGFPIVACCYLFWIHNNSEERHSEERVKMTEALTKMNETLTYICNMLEKDDEK